MNHWTLKIAAALGVVSALGYWRHQKGRRESPFPRQHVNACIDEVFALSDHYDSATNSVPSGRASNG